MRTPMVARAGRARPRALVLGAALSLVLAGCRWGPAPGSGTSFEGQARQVQRTAPATRPWFCNAVGNGTPPSGHGNGAHVHPHYAGMTKGPLSWDDCLLLGRQLDQTVKATRGFETKGKAEAAGWRPAAPYVPGLGTHHVRFGGTSMTPGGSIPGSAEIDRIRKCLADKGIDTSGGTPDFTSPAFQDALKACGVNIPVGGVGGGGAGSPFGAFDPAKPPILIYGGNDADAPLVGVAYAFAGSDTPPEAYAGNNDWWHLHTQTCFGLDPKKFPDPDDLSDAECRALGGNPQKIFPSTTGPSGVWLLHVWMAQPYEYRPDLFVSGHPCLGPDRVLPLTDPCWTGAHRDPARVTPTTSMPGPADHGDHGGH